MARRPLSQSRNSQSNLIVPLASFIVLFVVSFAVALWAFLSYRDLYKQINDGAKGRSEYSKPKMTAVGYQGYISRLEQKDDQLSKVIEERNQLQKILGVDNLNLLNDFATVAQELKAMYSGEEQSANLLDYIRRVLHDKQVAEDAQKEAEQYAQRLKADLATANSEIAKLKQEKADAIAKAQSAFEDKSRELTQVSAEKEDTISTLRKNIQTLSEKLDDERASYKKELQGVRQELVQTKKALEEVQTARNGGVDFKISTAEVDGYVLNVDPLGKSCTINIGSTDGAKIGMQFVVYAAAPGGKRVEKGTVEIKKLYDDLSYCGIVSLKDDLDPILTDDMVISPLFRKGQANIFVLENDIDQIEKKVLEQKIQRYGSRVEDAVTPQTDFVVIKDRPGENAQEATKWAVPVIRLSELEKVIGDN